MKRPPFERSLVAKFPYLAAQWDGVRNAPLTPADVYASSNKLAHWVDSGCGHEWSAPINSRSSGGNGCPFCANQRILVGFNDLASQNPVLAAQWHPSRNGELTPQEVTAFSGRRVWWLCGVCGWQWQVTVASRTHKPGGQPARGCPACAGQRSRSGVNDLVSVSPRIAAEWDAHRNGDRTPQSTAVSSGVFVWWVCVRGHSWRARVVDRTGKGNGCPTCSGRVPERGLNDLATTDPDLVREWHPTKNAPVTPYDVSAGSDKRVHWVCAICSHEWVVPVKKRALGGAQCRACVPHGTSRIEQDLSAAIAGRGYALAAQRRLPIRMSPWHPTMECDVILPAERIVIEYDGYPFHMKPANYERDQRKSILLLQAGWSLIRVRNNLEGLPMSHPQLRQIFYDDRTTTLGQLTARVVAAIRTLALEQRT